MRITSKEELILIGHQCEECGYKGDVKIIKNKFTICPSCKTKNDIWFGTIPPIRHIIKNFIARLKYGTESLR